MLRAAIAFITTRCAHLTMLALSITLTLITAFVLVAINIFTFQALLMFGRLLFRMSMTRMEAWSGSAFASHITLLAGSINSTGAGRDFNRLHICSAAVSINISLLIRWLGRFFRLARL